MSEVTADQLIGEEEIELASRVDDLDRAEMRRLVDVSLATRLSLRSLPPDAVDLWRRFESEIGETRLTLLWCSVGGTPRLVGLLDDLVVALLERRRDIELTAAVAETTDFRTPERLGLRINDALDDGDYPSAYEAAIGAVKGLATRDWPEASNWEAVVQELEGARFP